MKYCLILIFLISSSCVANENTGINFVNQNQKNIDLYEEYISFNGRQYPLINCSSETKYCYKNKELVLIIELPKVCSRGTWLPEKNDEWKIVQYFSHGWRAFYQMKSNDRYMFTYNPYDGLENIEIKINNKFEEYWLVKPHNYLKCEIIE